MLFRTHLDVSEGGMIRFVQTRIELKSFHSSCSSSKFSIQAFQAYPLVEITPSPPTKSFPTKSS